MRCFSCGQPGHVKAHCPARQQHGDSWDDHIAIIDATVTAWTEGNISIDRKRRMISDENRSFYGAGCPRRLQWPPR
jgi:hypothetical protein